MPVLPRSMLEPTDAQLYTLLALKELGSSTHLQLLYFMADHDIMTYFDLTIALSKLVKDGNAAMITHPADALYAITPAGEETLGFFMNRIPFSLVSLIRDKAPLYRERYAKEKQYAAAVTQGTHGDFIAHLCIMEGDIPAMELKFNVPTAEMAERLTAAWQQNAAEVYRYLLGTLQEDNK